ncbi:MAG: amino acid adenylation domain-containing protein, partial [Desulfobacterales bacterium]|nr:amino acid adenylation domain-containing protein [Desulfobacterales bacterium]
LSDKPIQIVFNKKMLTLNFLDWQDVCDEKIQLNSLLINEQNAGFNLNDAPLIRCQIIKLSKESYRFILNFHHIIIDGWSLPILFNEVIFLYKGFTGGKTPQLPQVNQFKDYIVWLNAQDHKKAQNYWKEELKGFESPTPIPIAKFLKESPIYEEFLFALNNDTTDKLISLSRKHRLTLNTIIQGVWGILLSRYSANDDILFGVTVSGRDVPISGIDKMIGLFLNTLPLRVKINDKQSIIPWLISIQNKHQENNAHAYCALSDIQSLSQIPKGTPLFDSIVVFENYPIEDKLKSTEISFSIEDVRSIDNTNYPLTLVVIPGKKLSFKLNYDRNLFEEGAILKLTRHFQAIIENIAENIDQTVTQIPILKDDELNQLKAWNNRNIDYPKDKTIVDLFEEQVEKNPDDIAVVFEEEKLTYKELNEKANQLAHYLIHLGVKPDTLIGICIERSLEMIIGLLGILKAGGAYLPIDPTYPKERISFMVKDANISIILTQEIINSKISLYPKYSPGKRALSENMAYLIYTSGSTGTPKGVMITHYNVTRLFFTTEKLYNFSNKDVWSLFHSYAFDFSVWEIFGALFYGGKLVIVPYNVCRAFQELHELLLKEGVTVLNQTPSAFQQLIYTDALKNEKLKLRLVIFGGEKLDIYNLKKWFDKYGDKSPTLVNMYGITETTVHVSYYPVAIEDTLKSGSIIGRPIPDLNIYILDKNLNPVPVGILGEMYIAGEGLARGYLNREDLTKERFIFHTINGLTKDPVRLYKTGDLARFLPDGNIEYIGRSDNQIKMRGFRIELGEIESVLCKYPYVRESTVILYDENENKRLSAYITLNTNHLDDLKVDDLKTYLKKYLPDYMIPSSIILLREMPLTPNGKIDIKSLPKPDITSDAQYIAPFTEIQQKIAMIWEQTLKINRIGIYDNFFELGGDSILSIQIVSKAKALNIHITPRDIFQHQTIYELAKCSGTISKISAEQGIITGELPLTPIQCFFFDQKLTEPWHYNQAVLFKVDNDIDIDSLKPILKEIIKHHDALRLRFKFIDNKWEQRFCDDLINIPVFAENKLEPDLYQKSLNLENGPLMKMVLFDLGDSKRLFWCIHHLAVDGVSW